MNPDHHTAHIFIGIQACGKSTFAKQRFSGLPRINLDELKTRARETALLSSLVEARKGFVVDNTNPTRAERSKYISPCLQAGYRIIGYFFRSRISEAMMRNANRASAVPRLAILGTSAKLEIPSKAEGFHELFFVSIDENAEFIVEDWRDEV